MNLHRFLAVTFVSLAVAGCDSQADSSYMGEPLATVRGSIVDNGSSPPAAEVVLVWDVNDHPLDLFGTSAPVAGHFPASFSMPLYTPPPDEALISSEDTGTDKVGIAYVVVVKAGTGKGKITDLSQLEDSMLGMSTDYVVAYLDHELQANSAWEPFLGGRPAPGYRLMEVVRKTDAEKQAITDCEDQSNAAFDACDAACPQDDTYDACTESCGNLSQDCGSKHDSFREAANGFAASITVPLGPQTQGIDWY